MKRYFLIIISVLLLFSSGCDFIYEDIYIDDIKEYNEIFEWDSRSKLKIFPTDIDNNEVVCFEANQQSYKWVGCGIEILLEVKYSKNEYKEEISRLSNIADKQKIIYDKEHFSSPSYVAMLGWNYSNEYATVNEGEKTITYVYFQLKEEDDLKILNKKLLPTDYYTDDKVNEFDFSIYD